MDGALVILFQAAFSLAVYCVADALCKTVICMDGMLAIFFDSFRICCVHTKKQPFA